jgi:putative ABC transport system permease protein
MFLAFREMRRAKGRFGMLVAAVALLVFLILTQQGLQDGLVTSFVGAIRRQSAPVLAYSTDGQRTLQGSVITPPLERAILGADGVGAAGRIGQGTFTVQVEGRDSTSDAALLGSDDPALGGVTVVDEGRPARGPGEVVGSASDFSVGDRVRVVPVGVPGALGPELVVVGLVEDARLQVTPTLFADWTDYEAAVRAANPDADAVLPSAIGLRPASGTTAAELVEAVNDTSGDADALTREDAADEAPGVLQVRQSFRLVLLLFGLVVPLVTGLFFLILTLQKAPALTLLRAVGTEGGSLVRALLLQVVAVIGAGLLLGTSCYLPLSQMRIGTIDLRFDPAVLALWSVVLLGLGLLSALVAVRRVLRIDPIEATTGGGAR